MLQRKLSWVLTTLAVCTGLWLMPGAQPTDAAGGGRAVQISIIGADGKPLSGAIVEFIRPGGKPLTAINSGKDIWLIKDADDKLTVAVRDGRAGGVVELAIPPNAIDPVEYSIRVDGNSLKAELVSAVSVPPVPNKPSLSSPAIRSSTQSVFNDAANRPPAPDKGQSPEFSNSAAKDIMFVVPPVNDNCADAAPVGPLPASVIGSNVDATDDAGSPSCGVSSGPFKNIWYTVVGTGNTITVSTCNAGTDNGAALPGGFDTKISVYCNDCGDRICVGGNDDQAPSGSCTFGTFKSTFTFCSEVGRTYLITVGGFSSTTPTGAIQLDVTEGAACNNPPTCQRPVNDTCAGAIDVGPLPASVIGNNSAASNDVVPACGSSPQNRTIWYSVVGDGNTLTATTCNAGTTVSDTELIVYCAECDSLLCIGGDDDGCPATPPGTLKSTFSWCSQLGATYYIAVGSFSATAAGDLQLEVSSSGSACANPISCLTVTGACCVAEACTATLEEADCMAAGGTWYAGESCPAFACPAGCSAGETCASAEVIPSVPFTDSGNTCSCADDLDAVCPYNTPGAPDTVYSYTPQSDQCVDISLCNGSAYDTKLYVHAGNCAGAPVACNDDLCASPNFPDPYVSDLSAVSLIGGTTYYIVVDGYVGFDQECGDYVLDIAEVPCPPPCGVCPPGGLAENEPNCGTPEDTVNGGCNSDPNVFSPIACGDTYCGTASWDGAVRDTDWYQITVTEPTEFTWTVQAEFDVVIGMVETAPLGNPDCNTATALDPFAVAANCGVASVTRCVPPGTYWWFVAPDFNGPTFVCGADYTATLSCVGCEPPTCTGDTCDAAQVIPAIPYSTSGDSCLCNDNYDEICPFVAAGSPDTVYSYTPAQDECILISMCANSAYDTKVYVYENACGAYQSGTAIACNDDECSTPSFPFEFVSEVQANLTAGNTYYIVVDGYEGECGNYTLDITTCPPPCDVVCAPGATAEGEPNCGIPDDTVNGGCNNAVPIFTELTCGEVVCGTAAFDDGIGLRDTDWYQITVAGSTRFTWSANSEFASLTGHVPTIPAGTGNCADVVGVVDPALFGEECVPGQVVTDCLPAGTYWFFMAPTFDDPVTCGKEYEVSLSCEPCVIPLGACCRPDGSCDDGVAEVQCENWQGDGTVCANVMCPQPPPNDDCANAIAVAVPSVTLGSTELSNFDSGLPATCGTSITTPGVWYSVIGNGNTLTADTCGAGTAYDSKISVFCPNCTEPACVGGNDDFCGLSSSVSWCSAPGETYLILVHGFGGQTGPFELAISDGPACSTPASCVVVDVCGGGPGDCCTPTPGAPGCSDAACCESVCACDSFCCDVEWDVNCAGPNAFVPGCSALDLCPSCQPLPPDGGCCQEDLSCTIATESDCLAAGGRYLGDGTSCSGPGAGNPAIYEADPNIGIPDGGGPGNPATHTINVPDSILIGDVNVDVVIPHTWVGDLIVTVEHNGTTVAIIDRPGFTGAGFGCPSNDYNIVLDDEGAGGLVEDFCLGDADSLPPSPPNYIPNESLSAFDGMDSAGDWTISVSDNAGFDVGSLVHWSLHIDEPGPSPCIPTGACCTSPTDCQVRSEADCALAGGVYLGDDTNCSASGPVTVYAADPAVAIPDGGGPADPAEHTINVPDSYMLSDVEIDAVITHTWIGDLIIEVEHNATVAVIVDRPGFTGSGFGCNSNNLDIVLDDQGAGGPVESLCGPSDASSTPTSPPNYVPNNPLSVFNGMDSAGAWTIRVSDNAGFDLGTLDHWSLHLHAPGSGPCEGVAFCGNGTVEAGEECDDGNASNEDACTNGCLNAECGDGYVQAGVEECDDGNASNTDNCTNACTVAACGDGFVQAGEQCDDGNQVATDSCTNTCQNARCGDGIIYGGVEQCDDGDQIDDDECTNACTLPICGDGIVQAGNNEECDGASADACDGVCLPDCTCEPTAIPTMSEWGLGVLALLLLIGAKLYFGRREVTA